MKLSCVIPSYKDPLIKKTVQSLLETSELETSELEIICVLDGYWIDPAYIVDDPRVRYVHLGKNRGMRGAINAGVEVARGEFLMRTDEHCLFAQGFDRKMTENCQPNWIMTARRYFLNTKKWEVMDLPYVDYEMLVIQEEKKFAGRPWRKRDMERKDIMIDETMAMQGSCWVMPHKWWDKVIGELQTEGYGPLYQDSHEMCFKAWQAGGKLMLNKNTFFAHKHRSFARTHNNGTAENKHTAENWIYSLNLWRDYYLNEIRPRWKI